MKFINPTQYETEITILPLFSTYPKEKVVEDKEPELEEGKGEERSLSSLSSSQPSSLLHTRQHSVTVDPRPIKTEINADVNTPSSSFILPLRDDAAEYDDSTDTHSIQDDPK